MGGGAAVEKFEIPTEEISREALFDLKHTKPGMVSRLLRGMGAITHKMVMFPFPGCAKMRLQYFKDSPSKSFTRHLLLGSAFGLVLGSAWRYWHIHVYNVKRDDFYKQLAIANAAEVEKFRNKLVQEAKERRGE